MSNFDSIAHQFERHRAFPDDVVEGIVKGVRGVLPSPAGWLLDLGAGTGRIGRALQTGEVEYVAVDRSFAMLNQFRQRSPLVTLIQADGCCLPFSDHSFSGVLLAHVLNSAGNWRELLVEARRVLRLDGPLILGQRVAPANGIDVELRGRLREILANMNIAMPGVRHVKDEARNWLAGVATSHERVLAAEWKSDYTPGDFLNRHPTGAWFSTLQSEVQEQALSRLRDWAISKFGSLDYAVVEEYCFELEVFKF